MWSNERAFEASVVGVSPTLSALFSNTVQGEERRGIGGLLLKLLLNFSELLRYPLLQGLQRRRGTHRGGSLHSCPPEMREPGHG